MAPAAGGTATYYYCAVPLHATPTARCDRIKHKAPMAGRIESSSGMRLLTAAIAVLAALPAAHASPLDTLHPAGAHWPRQLFKRLFPLREHNGPMDAAGLQSLARQMYLQPEDFERASVQPVRPVSDEQLQAMQIPTLFEGDIEGIPAISTLSDDADVFRLPYQSALNVATYKDKLWPAGRVPYALAPGLDAPQRAAVAQAFDEYTVKTCVRFVPKADTDFDYIYIKKNRDYGCSSYVGRAGGNQTVSLEVDKCFSKGIIAHELMHSLGFFHEHSRTDRDENVDIMEANIKPGMLRNFEKYPAKIIDGLGQPYDYDSVMHYHKLAFSRNGRPTILPKDRTAEIGQRLRLSEIDAAKINTLYKCDGQRPTTVATEAVTSTTAATTSPSISSTSTTTSSGGVTSATPASSTSTDSTEKSSSTSATTTAASTTATTEKPECKDLNAHCDMWAAIGHCEWSEKYMAHYCSKACHICTGGESTGGSGGKPAQSCHDKNLFCGYWARIGECESEAKFMKIFCRKSCKLCDKAGAQPATELPFA